MKGRPRGNARRCGTGGRRGRGGSGAKRARAIGDRVILLVKIATKLNPAVIFTKVLVGSPRRPSAEGAAVGVASAGGAGAPS